MYHAFNLAFAHRAVIKVGAKNIFVSSLLVKNMSAVLQG